MILYFILEKKFRKSREYLIQRIIIIQNCLDNYLILPKLDSSKQGQVILIIGEYMHRHATAIDPEINAACCLYEIMATI